MSFDIWDLVLFIVVSVLTLGVAYMPDPRHKALIMSLPLPSTAATLAVGSIGASNVAGFTLLLLFSWQVWFCCARCRMNIIFSIALAAGVFCLLGKVLFPLIPDTDAGFWSVMVWNMALGGILFAAVPWKREPAYKSPMPFWCKVPLVAGVVMLLIVMKKYMGGFIVAFPMVGVVGTYESRHALWGIARQVPLMMLSLGVLNTLARIALPYTGLCWALAIGWAGYCAVFFPLHRLLWRKSLAAAAEEAPRA